MLSFDMQFMLDEEKLQFLSWHGAQAAWHHGRYFAFLTEFDSFTDRLCHSGWSQTYNISKILSEFQSSTFGQTNVPCSAVSLR